MSVALPADFIALSAKLGRDPLLVQGAGGNTSLKMEGELWVKASGKWLSQAASEDLFVGLDLGGVRRKIADGQGDALADQSLSGQNGLRPSIETSLHALLPHAVVLHVHSIRTIAWAVRRDAESHLTRLLEGLDWALIPYCRPGLPLTAAIRQVTSGRRADVLVLANHGLVVGGADCESAAALLEEVERRLDLPPRAMVRPDVTALAASVEGSAYRLPIHDVAHELAFEPAATLASGGALYPDHVVFLGSGITVLEVGQALPRGEGEAPPPALLAIRGKGVLVRRDLVAGAEEMVLALALLTQRLPVDAPVSYLSAADEAALLGWDAETYRQSLARQHQVSQ